MSIRKELHAIRSSMENTLKTAVPKLTNMQNLKIGTNLDDKPTEESARISAALNNITSNHYQGSRD